MNFSTYDIAIIKRLFERPEDKGYTLNFSDKTMREFFETELQIDIDNNIYKKNGKSKLNRLLCLLNQSDKETVLRVITRLWEYRKTIDGGWGTAQDDAIYEDFFARIQRTDTQGGVAPITPTGIDKNYFLKGLESLKKLPAQQRGYDFEKWLNELFNAYNLSPKSAFRIKGEQIDGSFQLNGDTYLIEAKWQKAKTGNADLHTFHGKLDQKVDWVRGVFFSWAGFSQDGLEAWGRGKKVICFSGYDLYYMLTNNISLRKLLEEKIRKAAETGVLYAKIDEIFPNIIK